MKLCHCYMYDCIFSLYSFVRSNITYITTLNEKKPEKVENEKIHLFWYSVFFFVCLKFIFKHFIISNYKFLNISSFFIKHFFVLEKFMN